MAFGAATVTTERFKRMCADRIASSSGGASSSAGQALSGNPKWAAMGTGATTASRTAASSDTALSLEVETRTAGTVTLLASSSGGVASETVQNVATITATATRAVDEFSLNDTSSSGGAYADVSATLAVINLLSGDSIQFTTRVTFT